MPTIKFLMNPDLVDIIDPPKPASQVLPEWYKQASPYINEDDKHLPITKGFQYGINRTYKRCSPVMDAMTQGYVWTTSCDIQFVLNDPAQRVVWNAHPYQPLDYTHSREQLPNYPLEGEPFRWIRPFKPVTPKGYSMLFKHPSHRFDLPWFTLEGVVDTDKHPVGTNAPAILDPTFEGVIPKGTPVVQMIPFKRESWKSMSEADGIMDINTAKFTSKIEKVYTKNYRQKKEFK
jgi:hypothetical protein